MRKCGLRIRELCGGVRIAVERKDAPASKGARRQRVIEILSCGIAIDLDRDATLSRRMQTPRPNRRSRPRAIR